MTTNAYNGDVIDHLASIAPGSELAQLRAQRPDNIRYAQGSYEALFEPNDLGGIGRVERELLALRVATLTKTPALAVWHAKRLEQLGASAAFVAAIQGEPSDAPLNERETALITHVDLVALRAVASTRADVAALKRAGFSARDIVTISELIAFLAFQVRALHGLRVLAEDA